MKQFSPVVFCDPANHTAWVSGGNGPVWDIFCHDTSGTDHHVASDVYAGTDGAVTTNPYIIPDGHFFSVFKGRAACIRVDRMSGGINGYVGRQQAVISKCYVCHV